MEAPEETAAGLRVIPSVDAILRREDVGRLIERYGRRMVAAAVREIVARHRQALAAGGEPGDPAAFVAALADRIESAIAARVTSAMRRVINATGVVVHTNLGRAVLSQAARSRVIQAISSYVTLEYDLEAGRRGSRSAHLERGLSHLFPGHAAIAVNNNAAAVLLALATLADGREVVISRGELVEIGGSFRIPEIMARSGAVLREVGTTNRTRLSDYEEAIGPGTGLVLKVHRSNFRVVGFTEEVETAALAALARRHGLPLVVDQGSGCLVDLVPAGIRDEPTVSSVLGHGADLVTFSGDKILGGPQAGIAVGRPDLVDRMRRDPLYRAVRLDKMAIAALEATIDAYARGTGAEEIPVLRMVLASREDLEARARRVSADLAARLPRGCSVAIEDGVSRVGGGAAPAEDLPTAIIRISRTDGGRAAGAWEAALRAAPRPVIAMVREDALLLDLRTVDPEEEGDLVETVVATA